MCHCVVKCWRDCSRMARLTPRLAITIAVCAFSATALAQPVLIINEALVNEPSSQVTLEWVELWNVSPVSVTLDGVIVVTNGDTTRLPNGANAPAGAYIVIARSIAAFETAWGDASGVWGDAGSEAFALYQGSFQLPNSAGRADVYDSAGQGSVFEWASGGGDGVSWERVKAGVDSVGPSIDPRGGTPGRINSVSVVERDIGIANVTIARAAGVTEFSVTLTNYGFGALEPGEVRLWASPTGDSWPVDSLYVVSAPFVSPLPSGSIVTTLRALLPWVYANVGIEALVNGDERPVNNVRVSVAPGMDFPPMILTEVLPDPQGTLEAEWIEVRNVSNAPLDLSGWRVGDSVHSSSALETGSILAPDAYLVFTSNRTAFTSFYADLGGEIVEVAGWPTLNNSGDIVRLIDAYGFVADSLSYNKTPGDNRTLARVGETIDAPWGMSRSAGGSPTALNDAYLAATGSEFIISVDPNPFSPDADGFEDITTFQWSAPVGERLTVRLYDLQGVEIRALYEGASIDGDISWDGKDNAGRRAPVGVYIALFETELRGAKKTVVVAR